MTNWLPTLPANGKPRYIAIADMIERDISLGILMPGDRLPPQRQLADALGVDFTTISRAYNEAKQRNLIDSHVGRGSFIKEVEASHPHLDPRRTQQIDLNRNLPPEPTDPDLIGRMQNGLSVVSANIVSLLRYQDAMTSDVDKQAAISWLSMRGMVPAQNRIFITPGAHPAISVIVKLLANRGDVILCENITYPGLKSIADHFGIKLIGLSMDDKGIEPDLLDHAIKTHKPKALYLNPTLQNPTTLTIPADRRVEIADVLKRHNLPLIEDDAYGFVQDHAPAPFATTIPELTWHVAGLAKCIGAGLRLAYVIAPDTKSAFTFAKGLDSVTVMPSPLTMALATRWIMDGTADHIRRFIRQETIERQKIAAQILLDFTFQTDPLSFNLWIDVPKLPTRLHQLNQFILSGVSLTTSEAFLVNSPPSTYIRLGLGGRITRDDLREQLQKFAHVMHD